MCLSICHCLMHSGAYSEFLYSPVYTFFEERVERNIGNNCCSLAKTFMLYLLELNGFNLALKASS